MPKISVIVPVYNTEKYLKKCLDSIINQTLKDIEIICINDSSTDNSLQILKDYASNDNRIKLIDLAQNKGAANARNIGLEAASGEYIGFIDSDDFADLDFYEYLYKAANKKKADIVKGTYKYIQQNSTDYHINNKIKEDKNNFSFGFCSAIFKNKLIKDNEIKFPILVDMEDPIFAYNAAIKANRIEIIENHYININSRIDSQTSGTPVLSRIRDKFAGLQSIINIANNANISEKSYAYTVAFWINMIFINSISNKETECRLFIIDKIFQLLDKIKYKNTVLENLAQTNKFLSEILSEQNKNKILHYEQAQKIYYIRKKMKNE